MSDYQLAQVLDADGNTTFDRVLLPNGDWATVAGPDLVAQNILVFLLTKKGTHPLDPTFGIDALSGQHADPGIFDLALSDCLSYYQAYQARVLLPLNEQLAAIDGISVSPTDAIGSYSVSFTAHTRAGDSPAVILPT